MLFKMKDISGLVMEAPESTYILECFAACSLPHSSYTLSNLTLSFIYFPHFVAVCFVSLPLCLTLLLRSFCVHGRHIVAHA